MTNTAKRIRAGEIEVGYDELGAGDRPFVLVHGFTGSREDWAEVLAPLSAHGRTVAPDLRGHGETSHGPPEGYDLPTLVSDLAAFTTAIDAPQFDLLGHSMGGMTALRFALDHPERVRSLILMDTSSAPPPAGRREIMDAGGKLALAAGMGALFNVMKSAGMGDRPPSMLRVEAAVGPEAYWARIQRKIEAMDPHAFANFVGALHDHDPVTDRLGEIRCPTTVIVGVEDLPFVGASRVMAEKIPDADLVEIEDAAHSPQVENTARWLEAVSAHLARARG